MLYFSCIFPLFKVGIFYKKLILGKRDFKFSFTKNLFRLFKTKERDYLTNLINRYSCTIQLMNYIFTNLICRCYSFSFVVTRCHLFLFVVSLVVNRCHWLPLVVTCFYSLYHSVYQSLSFVVTRCHLLLLVIIRCHLLYHSLSLIVIRCNNHCHSLSLVVTLVVTRCTSHLSFSKQSIFTIVDALQKGDSIMNAINE